MIENDSIIKADDVVLVTGANGFIGSRVVDALLKYGFRRIRCFVRPTSSMDGLNRVLGSFNSECVETVKGNLLSREDCNVAAKGVRVIYHLAANTAGGSFPNAFMNSVVTARNLMDAALKYKSLKRFVNVSSFTVYSNWKARPGSLLDENAEVEFKTQERGDAYCYAKVEQEKIVMEYGRVHDLRYVILRPGAVFGPGSKGLTSRVGLGTFGVYLHLGGSNRIPFTYVDNCADAIVLAGLKPGIDGEIFNIVDDNLPSSRMFLRMYKKNTRNFRSIYLPKKVSYLLCYLWEWYSNWSANQVPPLFNRRRWASEWKGNRYSNEKLKKLVGWEPRVPFDEAAKRYFDCCRSRGIR